MSRLGRQISRGYSRFGKQLQSKSNVFGRALSNTAKDISSGLKEAQRINSGIEKSFSKTPLAPIISVGSGLLNAGLSAGQGFSSAVQSAGSGIRQLGAGNFDGASESFGEASNQGIAAGGALFV